VSLKEVEDVLALHSTEMTDRLSSATHASLRVQGKSLDQYSDELDLKTLKTYQTDQMSDAKNKLSMNRDPFMWRELDKLTLSRLLVFNARRGSAAAELTLREYSQSTADVDKDLSCSFSAVE